MVTIMLKFKYGGLKSLLRMTGDFGYLGAAYDPPGGYPQNSDFPYIWT